MLLRTALSVAVSSAELHICRSLGVRRPRSTTCCNCLRRAASQLLGRGPRRGLQPDGSRPASARVLAAGLRSPLSQSGNLSLRHRIPNRRVELECSVEEPLGWGRRCPESCGLGRSTSTRSVGGSGMREYRSDPGADCPLGMTLIPGLRRSGPDTQPVIVIAIGGVRSTLPSSSFRSAETAHSPAGTA